MIIFFSFIPALAVLLYLVTLRVNMVRLESRNDLHRLRTERQKLTNGYLALVCSLVIPFVFGVSIML